MDFITVFLIAIGLSIDSFAVSVVLGAISEKILLKNIVIVAFVFSFFQAIFPLVGWLIGSGFSLYIKEVDHWIAFVLLVIVGIKMIYEGFSQKDKNDKQFSEISYFLIATLGISTSIDAFVVGIGFGIFELKIICPVVLIGAITFIFSLLGGFLGKKISCKIGTKFEIFGGFILILIGTKILVEHLFFS
jgi:putative Mn2+ efflux pump MntP